MNENIQEIEISISREKYGELLKEVLESEYKQPLDSQALWRDSCIADEILGIEYKNSGFPNPPPSRYNKSTYMTSVYYFELKNPKRWFMAKVKYAHLSI